MTMLFIELLANNESIDHPLRDGNPIIKRLGLDFIGDFNLTD